MKNDDVHKLDYAGPRTNARKSGEPIASKLIGSAILFAFGLYLMSGTILGGALFLVLALALLTRCWQSRPGAGPDEQDDARVWASSIVAVLLGGFLSVAILALVLKILSDLR